MKMQNRFEMKGENFVHSVLNYIDILFEHGDDDYDEGLVGILRTISHGNCIKYCSSKVT